MGNLDHVQRANADKESCNNCHWNARKFKEWPCNECKGNEDMFFLNPNVPAVTTGRDLGYPERVSKLNTKPKEYVAMVTIMEDAIQRDLILDSLDKAMQVHLDECPGMKVTTTLKEDKGYA